MDKKVRHLRAARYPGSGRQVLPVGGKASGDVRVVVENAYELFRRCRWMMLAVFAATIAASIIYVSQTPPEFAAQSVVVIDEQKYDPSNALSLGSISGLDNTTTTMHLMVLAQSNSLADRVANRVTTLKNVPGTSEQFSLLALGLPPQGLAREIQFARISVESTVPNVIHIKAKAPSAREAAALANVFADEAIDQSKDISRIRVSASRQFLEQRVREGESMLQSAEARLQDYLKREGTVALDTEVHAAISNLSRIEVAEYEAQIELEMRQASLRSTEAELLKIKPMLTQRVASGVDREIATGQTRLAELEVRLEQAYQQYPALRQNPQLDPRIEPLQREISQWKTRIHTLSEQYVAEVLAAGGTSTDSPESGVAYAASLERQLVADRIATSGLESKIRALADQRAQLEERLKQAPKQTVEIAQLQRARKSSEELFGYLEQRLHEAQLAEESETGSLRLLRSAEVPALPVSPRPERIYPMAAALGLLLSFGAASLSMKLDRRLYTPTDIESAGFRLLGVVPDLRKLTRKEFGGAKQVNVDGLMVHSNMVSLLAPHTAAAEAYRHLYARLRSEIGSKSPKSIIVTSPEAGVGKSTTALNLALAAASARLRTLIIDADMRRPAVEKYLGINCGVTLQDIFELPESSQIVPHIMHNSATGIYNLHAITVREPIQNPLEHLLSPHLQRLTELLKQQFDIIIFDAPPLLLTPDASLLAPLCDAAVVVIAAGETDGEALRQIENELTESRTHIAGIILNRFDASNRVFRSTYGYLQHHYGGYYRPVAG